MSRAPVVFLAPVGDDDGSINSGFQPLSDVSFVCCGKSEVVQKVGEGHLYHDRFESFAVETNEYPRTGGTAGSDCGGAAACAQRPTVWESVLGRADGRAVELRRHDEWPVATGEGIG
jgi:hypothetical protein